MKPWSNLAKVVYRRTYARQDNGVLENWDQTVERVVQGNIQGHNVPEQEIKDLLWLAKNRKAIPAGRGLWYSGSPYHKKLGGAGLCNCWYLDCSDWNNFVIAQDLLMLGGGVGMSVEHRFTSKLPKIKKGVVIEHKATKDADFIVPDSREGWCELVHRVLESFFVTGKSFTFSTVCVRGYGELIHGFGGKASGPIPLISFIEKISKILGTREGKALRPIDAGDIICATGEMVVAGNVRRSAIILLGDPWDKEYLKAKRWDLGGIPTYRSCANYSVVCEDIEDLHPLFWKTYEQGEAFGLFNRKNAQKFGRMGELRKDSCEGLNPCQSADATVLTPEGIRTFSDIDIGSVIWSGKNWTKVTNKICTGEKFVREYHTNAGVFIGTENHRVVSYGQKVEVNQVSSLDICRGPSEKVHLDGSIGGDSYIQDIMDGVVIGDGSVHKASNNLVYLCVGEKDQDYYDSEISPLMLREFGAKGQVIKTTISPEELPKTYNRVVPERFYKGNSAKVSAFLLGLFSANGSVLEKHGRIVLKQSSKVLIHQVRDMLSGLGIKSYITSTGKSKLCKFKNGTYECKPTYQLSITQDRNKFRDKIGFIQIYKTEALENICDTTYKSPFARKFDKITWNITNVVDRGIMPVYDITVDDPDHTYWTGGILVSNCGESTLENGESCNLVEIPLMNLDSEDEFEFAGRTLFRYAKRVCLEKYHHKVSADVIKRNMRVGVGITGCLGSPLFNPTTLDRVYNAIQDEDAKYSKELNVSRSIKTSLCKPSGTVSKVVDQEGYEGIHAGYSHYMIQRIRFSADDPLIPLLKKAGHNIEPVLKFDGTCDQATLVVDFYIKTPDGFPVADEDWDTWKQLDILKMAQKHWADQAVSVTVYYKKEEIPQLRTWLLENFKYLKSISFLCHSEHGFLQAPKEAITKDQFEKLSAKIKPIEMDDITDGEMLTSMECQSGACPIK